MATALIVDDNEENRYLLQSMLRGNGYDVVTATNGGDALALARGSAPDIVISDILMPGMDGFALCREWKGDEKLNGIPFVFYTATYTHPNDEAFALRLGADRFIVKPAEPESFLRMVADVLSSQHAGGLRQSTRGPGSSLATETGYLKEYNETLIRKLEDKLVELEELNKTLTIKDRAIASSISGIVIADLAENITYVNEAMTRMWGFDEDASTRLALGDLLRDARELQELRAALRASGSWFGDLQAKRKDGSAFVAQCIVHEVKDRHGSAVCLMVSGIDITDRRRAEKEQRGLEQQLRQAQKMEVVGRLASGVAHDLNNLLTPILGYAELALLKLAPEDAARLGLHAVAESAERARDLTHQLLAFSRKQPMEFKPVSLSDIVGRFEKILRRTVREDVRLITRLAPSGATVYADSAQLQQVLLNLVVNANDAMPSGGALTVMTDEVVCAAAEAETWPEAAPGPHLRLMVQDTGCGMDEETRRHLFEPFFTTKPVGKGTGLGLATCHSIVKQHRGHFRVDSAPGRGSTFAVYLPCTAAGAPAAEPSAAPDVPGKGETILVVDDSRSVRALLRNMLTTLGYVAVEAATSDEAVRAARDHAGPVQLLITDVIIPGTNGRRLYEALRAIRKDLRVLYISGYTDEIIAPHGVLEPGIHFLAKPFTMRALTDKLRQALSEGA